MYVINVMYVMYVMCTYMHLYIYIYIFCVSTFIYVHLHTYVYIHVCVCGRMCLCEYLTKKGGKHFQRHCAVLSKSMRVSINKMYQLLGVQDHKWRC